MRRGFSLIEVAIAMAVAGLMLAYIFRGGASVDCITPTKQQLATIGVAVDAYVKNSNHTHYPKPAGRAVGITSPQFGRAATNASDIDSANGVLSGALPFAELGLAPSYAADCWGNKFTYVVTEALTSPDSVTGFKNPAILGNISVKDSAGNNASDKVAYAVISHGPNGLGAVAQNYSDANTPPNKKWCTGATGSLDTNNCDIKNATIYNAEFNNGKGAANFFDDLLNFSGKPVRKACAADDVIWGGTCTGHALAAKDGETQSVTDLNYNANVATVTCDDGELKSTGTCTPPLTCNATNPLNGSALTLSEGESSIYSGGATCTQLSCCGGTTVTTTPSPCPAAGVHAAGANCPVTAQSCTPSNACLPGGGGTLVTVNADCSTTSTYDGNCLNVCGGYEGTSGFISNQCNTNTNAPSTDAYGLCPTNSGPGATLAAMGTCAKGAPTNAVWSAGVPGYSSGAGYIWQCVGTQTSANCSVGNKCFYGGMGCH